jgi:hypothetical protein
VDAEASQLPVQGVAGRSGLVADLELRGLAELAEQPSDGLRAVGDRAERPDLVAALGHCDGDGFGVHIHPHKYGTLAHATGSFHV